MPMGEETKDRTVREREVRDKKIDVQLKHLDRIQTFVFGAMIGVSIAVFREEESFKEKELFKLIGSSVFALLLLLLLLLIFLIIGSLSQFEL